MSDAAESSPEAGKARFVLLSLLGLCWLFFQLYLLFSPQPPLVGRPIHLGFALLVFLVASSPGSRRIRTCVDLLLCLAVVSILGYYVVSWPRLGSRMEAVDPVLVSDLLFCILFVGITLEAVRRTVGWSLLTVILTFLLFAFIGRLIPSWTSLAWIPELFKYSGFTPADAAENFTMTPNGLLGITTSTSLTFVFYYVLFGAFYSGIGGGRLFIDIGLRLTGKQPGGPAKAAVVSSGLMGSISGSAVANVATTGIFTIPLMRRVGYRPVRAGAIEAIASTGGQLMPPVMGIAAFVMADMLQEDYVTIALAGLIPALAFYWSIFLSVDLHARRTGLGKAEPGESAREPVSSILRRIHLLLPLIVLLGLLFYGFSAGFCAVCATAACVILGLLQRNLSPREWLHVLVNGVRQAATVAIPIAAIGLIIEIAIQSGLVLEFSVDLIELGGGSMVGAMLWIVLGCLIMGMGLPTVAAYIIGAVLFVPALLEFGLPKLGAHFFVMYYCVLSMVTPPIALASYTAAGLAGAPVMKTCLTALRLSAAAFIIPFAFVFSPALLAQGSPGAIAGHTVLLLGGTSLWAVVSEGWLFGRLLTPVQRAWLGLTALTILTLPATVPALLRSREWGAVGTWSATLLLALAALGVGLAWSLKNERHRHES